jgi:hypothetical protein
MHAAFRAWNDAEGASTDARRAWVHLARVWILARGTSTDGKGASILAEKAGVDAKAAWIRLEGARDHLTSVRDDVDGRRIDA